MLQREVLSPLAELLLGGDLTTNSHIHLDALPSGEEATADGAEPLYEFVFTIEPPDTEGSESSADSLEAAPQEMF